MRLNLTAYCCVQGQHYVQRERHESARADPVESGPKEVSGSSKYQQRIGGTVWLVVTIGERAPCHNEEALTNMLNLGRQPP